MEPAKTDTTPDCPETSFEEILNRLSELVERLEAGELPLEDSLAVFEEGVRLSRLGTARLDSAESRVEELLREASEPNDERTRVDNGADL